MGLSEDEASEIIQANQRAYDRILQALLKVDAYNWQVGALTNMWCKNRSAGETAIWMPKTRK